MQGVDAKRAAFGIKSYFQQFRLTFSGLAFFYIPLRRSIHAIER